MTVLGSSSGERIVEPAREIPVVGKSDVLVVGGGAAGIGAALAAARGGAQTTLVEHYGCLGGMWTTGLLNPILDYQEKGGIVEDGVCVVRFNIDVHAGKPAVGTKAIHIEGGKVKPYHIPYRVLVPINREHLLMAGRCVSGSSRAHASFRVTGDCVAMGQAAGTAAALTLHQGIAPSALDPVDLVRQLRADGVKL